MGRENLDIFGLGVRVLLTLPAALRFIRREMGRGRSIYLRGYWNSRLTSLFDQCCHLDRAQPWAA